MQGRDLVISDSTLCMVDKAPQFFPDQKTSESVPGKSSLAESCSEFRCDLLGARDMAGAPFPSISVSISWTRPTRSR